MLRTALSVLVAAALLGLALPVVNDARVAHGESQVRTELDNLETAAADLRGTSDPVQPGTRGARLERTLRVPTESWGRAGIERLHVPASANRSVRWRVRGGGTRTRATTPPLIAPPDGLTIRERGRHRLRLELQRHNGTAVVVVSRADV